MIKLKNVSRYTRAGRDGKKLICPECDKMVIVYNFAWSSLKCHHCKREISKLDWLVKPKSAEKPAICKCCGADQVYQEKYYSPRHIGGNKCDNCLFEQSDWEHIEALPESTLTLRCVNSLDEYPDGTDGYTNCQHQHVVTKAQLKNSYLYPFYGHPRRHFPDLNYHCPTCGFNISGPEFIQRNLNHIKNAALRRANGPVSIIKRN